MVKRIAISAGLVGLLMAESPLLAQNQPRQGAVIGYFLPRARVDVVVNQLLRACPTAAHPAPVIQTDSTLNAPARPDPAAYVRLDARSHFLSGRSTKLALRNDGTLSSFNVTTTGEGGEVLSAAIGLAATVAESFVGIPPVGIGAQHLLSAQLDPGLAEALMERRTPATRLPLECRAEVAEQVRRLAEVESALTGAHGHDQGAGADADPTLTASLTAEYAMLVDQLTLGTPISFDPERAQFGGAGPALELRHTSPHPVDYSQWFTQSGADLRHGLEQENVGGRNGVVVILRVDRGLLDTLAAGDGSAGIPADARVPSRPSLDLYYLRPAPVAARVAWCQDQAGPEGCTPASGTLKGQTVLLPQLSGLFSLPVGRGSIFGTRSAAATFDEQGAPLTLEYGGTRGGSAIASTITAGGAAFTTLRDAGTAAITRQYNHDKALHDLEALNATSSPASDAAQP